MTSKDGRIRKNVTRGSVVQIILKEDQKNGHLTKGVVVEVLSSEAKHSQGIKVRLKSGKVGRVRKILMLNKGEETEKPEENDILSFLRY